MYWLLTSAGKIFSRGRYVDDVGKKKKKKYCPQNFMDFMVGIKVDTVEC